MSIIQERTRLWLTTQKIKAYLKGSPFQKEGVCVPAWRVPQTLVRETPGNLPSTTPLVEPKVAPLAAWLDLPLYAPTGKVEVLILAGYITRVERQSGQTLSPLESETLTSWMKAINLTHFGAKRFPWADKNVTVSYPEARAWLTKVIAQTQPRFVLSLSNESLSFFTGYPTLMEFIHGVDFIMELKGLTLTILPTYSLAEVTHDPTLKAHVWRDLKRLLGLLNLPNA